MLAIFQLMFLVISFLVSKVIKFLQSCKAKHTFLALFAYFETIIAYFESPSAPCYDQFELGFQAKTVHNIRGYIVVHRSAEEMRSMRHQMANTDTDDTEVF